MRPVSDEDEAERLFRQPCTFHEDDGLSLHSRGKTAGSWAGAGQLVWLPRVSLCHSQGWNPALQASSPSSPKHSSRWVSRRGILHCFRSEERRVWKVKFKIHELFISGIKKKYSGVHLTVGK